MPHSRKARLYSVHVLNNFNAVELKKSRTRFFGRGNFTTADILVVAWSLLIALVRFTVGSRVKDVKSGENTVW